MFCVLTPLFFQNVYRIWFFLKTRKCACNYLALIKVCHFASYGQVKYHYYTMCPCTLKDMDLNQELNQVMDLQVKYHYYTMCPCTLQDMDLNQHYLTKVWRTDKDLRNTICHVYIREWDIKIWHRSYKPDFDIQGWRGFYGNKFSNCHATLWRIFNHWQ